MDKVYEKNYTTDDKDFYNFTLVHLKLYCPKFGTIKLTINEAKQYDESLEELHNDSRFNKKFVQAFAKYQVMEFLNTHPKKKEIVAEFNDEHHINESDLKILKEGKDLVIQPLWIKIQRLRESIEC